MDLYALMTMTAARGDRKIALARKGECAASRMEQPLTDAACSHGAAPPVHTTAEARRAAAPSGSRSSLHRDGRRSAFRQQRAGASACTCSTAVWVLAVVIT